MKKSARASAPESSRSQQLERLTDAVHRFAEEFSPDVFDELVSEIAEAVTVVGQEQVHLLLTSLDEVRAKLLAAIKTPTAQPKADKEATVSASLPSQPTLTTSPKRSGPGRLF